MSRKESQEKILNFLEGQIVCTNTITFTEDELTTKENRAWSLHIVVECHGIIISKVLSDNEFTRLSCYDLKKNRDWEINIHPNGMMCAPLTASLRTNRVRSFFYYGRHPIVFNLFLDWPWIYIVGAVLTNLHQRWNSFKRIGLYSLWTRRIALYLFQLWYHSSMLRK